jgi:hypothetical protein
MHQLPSPLTVSFFVDAHTVSAEEVELIAVAGLVLEPVFLGSSVGRNRCCPVCRSCRNCKRLEMLNVLLLLSIWPSDADNIEFVALRLARCEGNLSAVVQLEMHESCEWEGSLSFQMVFEDAKDCPVFC